MLNPIGAAVALNSFQNLLLQDKIILYAAGGMSSESGETFLCMFISLVVCVSLNLNNLNMNSVDNCVF